MIEKKPWGHISQRNRYQRTYTDLIHVLAGGYSSIHYHSANSNTFITLDGEIVVCCYEVKDGQLVWSNSHLVKTGFSVEIDAGQLHRFFAPKRSVVLEVYANRHNSIADPLDIRRVGGHLNGLMPVDGFESCADLFAEFRKSVDVQ